MLVRFGARDFDVVGGIVMASSPGQGVRDMHSNTIPMLPNVARKQAENESAAQQDGNDELLCKLPRSRQGEPPAELRVMLRQFKGHSYVDARIWSEGYPSQRGITIKVRELREVIAALERADSEAKP